MPFISFIFRNSFPPLTCSCWITSIHLKIQFIIFNCNFYQVPVVHFSFVAFVLIKRCRRLCAAQRLCVWLWMTDFQQFNCFNESFVKDVCDDFRKNGRFSAMPTKRMILQEFYCHIVESNLFLTRICVFYRNTWIFIQLTALSFPARPNQLRITRSDLCDLPQSN